jgi:hypothetical protein
MPDRIQQTRKPGWRKPEGAVSVARPSRWGNPYRVVQMPCTLGGQCWTVEFRGAVLSQHIDTRELAQARAVELFRDVVRRDSPGWDEYRQRVRTELRGRDLMCFCKRGTPCHADVLLEIANG